MDEKRDQHKVGIPERRRGQQMGDERSVLHHSDKAEWEETPEITGDVRASESEFFDDESSQHFGGDPVSPTTFRRQRRGRFLPGNARSIRRRTLL